MNPGTQSVVSEVRMQMKRKLHSESMEENQTMMKMFKLNQSDASITNLELSEVGSGRKFNFKLTDKRAKSNLLKSASRDHFELDPKQKSTNLKFSAGSFIMVAKPMIKECEARFRSKSNFVKDDMVISVAEFRDGIELNDKHFDTKVVFSVNKKKVVLHCYNSTQNLKVDGSIYKYF